MKTGLHVALYSFFLLILASSTSFADCQIDGVTPDGGNRISCPAPVQVGILNNTSMPATTAQGDEIIIPVGGGVLVPMTTVAINTSNGDDIVRVFGEVTSNDSSALVTVGGNDTVIIDGGVLSAGGNNGNALATGNDDDTVTVNSGSLTTPNSGNALSTGTGFDIITINGGFFGGEVDSGSDDDMVTVNGGTFDNTLSTGSGNDNLIMNGGEFANPVGRIILGNDDDTITLNTDIDLNGGNIQCSDGFDTIVFAMEVPGNRLGFITGQILRSDPNDGEVVINDIVYRWFDCEELIPNLTAGPDVILPLPTLSEWGLIAMAGVLGLFSLMVIRRRSIA